MCETTGVGQISSAVQADLEGLYLLFSSGKRPTRAALKGLAEEHHSVVVSHDPIEDSSLQLVTADDVPALTKASDPIERPEFAWLELLRDGLTFDLLGLAPGEACALPQVEHNFDFDGSPGSQRLEALKIVPGQHLAGVSRSEPLAKAMIGLARDFVHQFEHLEAIIWQPAQSLIGKRFFESVTTAWLEGGAFPALGLTAFKETIDGALQSVGLDFWIGQELRVEPPLSSDKVSATRLAVRLVNQLVLIGGLDKAEHVVAPDGSQLVMRPSRNGKFVRISLE